MLYFSNWWSDSLISADMITCLEASLILQSNLDLKVTLTIRSIDDSLLVVLQALRISTSYHECCSNSHWSFVTNIIIRHIKSKFLGMDLETELDIDLISVKNALTMSCSMTLNRSAYSHNLCTDIEETWSYKTKYKQLSLKFMYTDADIRQCINHQHFKIEAGKS